MADTTAAWAARALHGAAASAVRAGLIALVACGGGKKAPAEPVAEAGGDDPCGGDPCAGGEGDDLLPPETLDGIQRALDGKRRSAARCLADAINAGKAPRNARGAVTLQFVISAGGQARDIQVIKSSVQNADVEQCVIAKVGEIDFGQLGKDLDWSYTYAFESM